LIFFFRKFHADVEARTKGLSLDKIDQIFVLFVIFAGLLVDSNDLSVDLFVIIEQFYIFEEVHLLVCRKIKVFIQLKSSLEFSRCSIILRFFHLEAIRCLF
jgi:hypothetical protein